MILTLSELNSYTPVEEDLLNNSETYKHYERICKNVYFTTIENTGLQHREYQYKYAALYSCRKKNICAASQGTGKTIIAGIAIAAIYQNLSELRPGTVHITVPTKLIGSTRWMVDLAKIPSLKNSVEFITTEKQVLNSIKPIWIYHVDFPKRKSRTLTTTRSFISRLMYKHHRCPSFLIVDEVHHLQKGSERSKHLEFLKRKSKRLLALSGTLSDGRLDLINFIGKFIYGNLWRYNNSTFSKEFGTKSKVTSNYLTGDDEPTMVEIPPRYLPHIATNKLPDYYQLSRKYIHRVSLNDTSVRSCVTLPKLSCYPITLPLEDWHKDAYQQVYLQHYESMKIVESYGKGAIAQKKAFGLLHPLISTSNSPGPITSKAKKAFELIQQNIQEGIKTVIYSCYIATSRQLYGWMCHRFGESQVVRLYAQDPEAEKKVLSANDREERLSEFLFNPEVRVGVFSTNLTSEGIDLTQASCAIFYDLPWVALKVQQAISRIERPGQVRNEVSVYFLNHKGTIDEYLYELLLEKTRKSKVLLDFEVTEDIDVDLISPVNPIDIITKILTGDSNA